nr:DUF2239 family protein [uncultured Neokomagataea sp.]
MSKFLSISCTAFSGTQRVASGALIDVALAIKSMDAKIQSTVLTFDDFSGAVIDFDLRGTTAEIVTRLNERGALEAQSTTSRSRGRPKLGVVAREITLLPRHWDWLARQSGGASQTLRRLVDEARRTDDGKTARKAAHERAYRFLSALAGDLPGYEDAIRALFAENHEALTKQIATWPSDIQDYVIMLAQPHPEKE